MFLDNTLKTKLSDWASSKQNFISIQQQCLREESQQKIKHAEEKHQQEMKHKKDIHEQKMQMNKEEHEMKLSILKLQKQKLIKELAE